MNKKISQREAMRLRVANKRLEREMARVWAQLNRPPEPAEIRKLTTWSDTGQRVIDQIQTATALGFRVEADVIDGKMRLTGVRWMR